MENFMRSRRYSERSRGTPLRNQPLPPRGCSTPLRFARNDNEGSCELPQEPQIVLREETNIRDVEQNHREPVHAETERVAAPFFRVIGLVAARFVDLFENRGMDD